MSIENAMHCTIVQMQLIYPFLTLLGGKFLQAFMSIMERKRIKIIDILCCFVL